jgi:hypothetical protein
MWKPGLKINTHINIFSLKVEESGAAIVIEHAIISII